MYDVSCDGGRVEACKGDGGGAEGACGDRNGECEVSDAAIGLVGR